MSTRVEDPSSAPNIHIESLTIDVGFPSVYCEYALLQLVNNKLLQPMTGQNKTRWEIQTQIHKESRKSERYIVAAKGDRHLEPFW